MSNTNKSHEYRYVIESFPLDADSLVLSETLFHNANGYIGVRSNFEEGYPDGYRTIRGMYLNGVYDFTHMNQAEKLHGLIEEKQTMLNVADTQSIELFIGDEPFSLFHGNTEKRSRTLDMQKGVTIREVVWESEQGKRVQIRITRMTSFVRKNLFLIKYEVTPLNFSGEISFLSTHEGEVTNFSDPTDPRVAGEVEQYLHVNKMRTQDGFSTIVASTSRSDIQIASVVCNVCEGGVITTKQQHTSVTQHISVSAMQNQAVTLYKYTVLGDSIRYADPEQDMQRCMEQLLAIPPAQLYEEQAKFLDDFWSNSVLEIAGDNDLQKAILYNQYQLLQSATADAYGNIAAKGLSGEGYEGHYFWDTEMYMLPFFLLNLPETAKTLIRFRYRTLPHARENARELGHLKGALYPWRTIMGRECSGYFPSGTAAYHINGDVAYSVVAYYLATKDIAFMAECGAEILVETARLWMDLGSNHQGKFHLNEVTGPDEYTCMVNNNYYTNVLAQYNLRWAVKIIALLKAQGKEKDVLRKLSLTSDELEGFENAANAMCLPYDEALGINPQDDSFLQKKRWDLNATPKEQFPLLMHHHPLHLYRYQVCKQADTVLAHFILEDAQSLDTIRRSYAYYEQITTHDSSLSTCIFSIMAARLGDVQKAYDYFGESAKLDLFNTHHNTKDGIHTANMGGTYMAIVYGFGGLRLKESGICFRPVLPTQWQGYRFQVLYQGRKLAIAVDKERCLFELISGDPLTICVYDQPYTLSQKVELPTRKEGNDL